MRRWWFLLTLAAIGCIATSALPFLSMWDTRPDVFLMFTLAAAMRGRRDRVVWVAFGCGLAKDVCGHGPLGAHAALFLLAAGVVLSARPLINVAMVRMQIAVTALVCLGCHLIYACLFYAFNTHMDLLAVLVRVVLITLLTTLLMPIVTYFTRDLIPFLHITTQPGFSHRHR